MNTEDNISNPAHYKAMYKTREVECIDFARLMPFNYGNAFKYVWRAGKKGGEREAGEDLKKALWYIRDVQNAEAWYDTELSFSVKNRLKEMFRRIQGDGSLRWKALVNIAAGNLTAAEEFINAMLEETEKEP